MYKHNSAPHTHSQHGENVGFIKCKSKSAPPRKPVTPVTSLYQKGVIWS